MTLDWNTFVINNSGTQKEAVRRTNLVHPRYNRNPYFLRTFSESRALIYVRQNSQTAASMFPATGAAKQRPNQTRALKYFDDFHPRPTP